MPQEPVGRTASRKPTLALLVGLALLLMAHVVACAAHAAASHTHPAAAASSVHAASGADDPPQVSDASDCAADGEGDDHPGHGATCCDPADWTANVRAPAGALLLALSLLALLVLRRRGEDRATSGGPPGGRETSDGPSPGGPRLLRLVCVSRT
ncbi:hypothetical protein [Streptomyces sp. R35]|uniref:MYXO-CTERM domain-containing protein n=1 Tax=Streptomyces sp. R35 TaxID=3238630 RepID=A0AB39S185_9ACTN